MSKTILVTGAAGFIGSHTVDALLRRGDVVVGLDNLDEYYSPARKLRNLEELRAPLPPGAKFHFVKDDLRNEAALEELFREHAFDSVVHLAAMPGVRASVERPHLYLDVNLGGTLNLLEQARGHRLQSFVFASTSSVYGADAPVPFVETDPCDRPLAPYPASKRAAELLGYTYWHVHGIPFTALRFFTVYGPRGRPDMMPYKILNHLFRGDDIPLYGGGQMLRDWTAVSDIVAGVIAAVDRPLGYEIINLGRGEPTLLADFIAEVEKQTGKQTKLRPESAPSTDMARTHADISKAERLLGYRPTVSIGEGIERFLAWYRSSET